MALQITVVNLDLMLDKIQVMKLPTDDTALRSKCCVLVVVIRNSYHQFLQLSNNFLIPSISPPFMVTIQ